MPSARSHSGSAESNRSAAGQRRRKSGVELPVAERRESEEQRASAGTVIAGTLPATSFPKESVEHGAGWRVQWQQQQQQIEQALSTIQERLNRLAGGAQRDQFPGPQLSIVGLSTAPECPQDRISH